MLDIPEGMAAMGFSKGKFFAERWFNGRAFVGPTNEEETTVTRYPGDMVNDGTIKMAWLLGFDSIKDKYDVLIESSIHSINAKRIAKEKIERFLKVRSRFNGTLHTRKYCGDDLQRLHHEFQFQFIPITDLDTLKSFAPTDLTASLGNFNLYASIASMDITTDVYNRYDTPRRNTPLHSFESRDNPCLGVRKRQLLVPGRRQVISIPRTLEQERNDRPSHCSSHRKTRQIDDEQGPA